jgi:hypothetical protein
MGFTTVGATHTPLKLLRKGVGEEAGGVYEAVTPLLQDCWGNKMNLLKSFL